jgi:NTE family protein
VSSKKVYNLGLALGGGGVRGLAHLGVLQVFDREGIKPNLIVGTSVGSIIGAAYALFPDGLEVTRRGLAYLRGESFRNNSFKKVLFNPDNVEQNFFRSLVRNIKKGYVFSSLIRKPSIFKSERLYNVISELIPDVDFKECQIPFAVPAIDIRSGKEVLLSEGSLRKALLASCSLPGFFPAVEHEGMLLCDAGVISPVPVTSCRSFDPKVLVAVDISTKLQPVEKIEIGLDAILRTELIAGGRINEMELEKADAVIQPPTGQKEWSDFSDLDGLIESGIGVTKEKLPAIRELLDKKANRFWKTAGSSA